MTNAVELIYCPLCELPHRVGAVRCDGCDQVLRERPDIDAMRSELSRRKRDMAVAGAVIFVMMVLNLTVLASYGGFVIVTAPVGWCFWSWIRYRALSRCLARLERLPQKNV
jgi:hypothetical protein